MTIATHPRAYATVTGPTAMFVSPDGHTEPLTALDDEDIRHAVVRRAADEARRSGAAVELVTSGDRGVHWLLVDTDGTVAAGETVAWPTPAPRSAVVESSSASDRREEVREMTQRREPQPSAAPAAESPSRASFIADNTVDNPAASGWRGAMRRLGITLKPSAAEAQRADLQQIVSRQWAGCRTVAVANGKGGVGKTITTAMLAAVYARHGGGNVLAWDNNDTRGTLGWRTETGLYDTTVRDLLPAASQLLAPTASVSDIAAYVHHQSTDRYDVLRSNPELLAVHQRIAQAEFDRLMQVAARYYRMVVFDSGNDESADRWLRMVDSSYQLVIPTLTAPESAESASLLLDALRQRDERSRWLADNAVVVVTQSEPSPLREAFRIADGFSNHVRAVEIVNYDPALKSGPLRFDSLRPATRDAWLRVAAAAATAL